MLLQSTIYFFAGSQGVNLGAQIFTRSTTWKTLNRKVFCPIYLIKFREAWNKGQLFKGGVVEKRLRITALVFQNV